MASIQLDRISKDGRYDLAIITRDTLDDALAVIREAFFIDENVSIGTQVAEHPGAISELQELCVHAAHDGVSVVAIDRATQRAVSAFFNKIQVPAASPDAPNYFEEFEARCKEPSARALMRYMIEMERRYDVFAGEHVACTLEIMFIGTLREHRGRGLASELWQLSMDIARRLRQGDNVKVPLEPTAALTLAPVPEALVALATSNATARIAEKFDFRVLLSVPFEEFSFAGKTFAERIGGDTPTSTIVFYRLT